MLYIINKNHADNQALHHCLQRVSAGDSVLLIEHAVYAALDVESTPLQTLPENVGVFVLKDDMQARGVPQAACLDFIQLVDYQGFVELVTTHTVHRSYF